MGVPYIDILTRALRVIRPIEFEYRKPISNVTDDFGQRTPAYGPWTWTSGHVQPGIISSFGGKNVGEKDYKDFGIDTSKSTITVWIRGVDLNNTARGKTCDQVRYCGRVYNVFQCADWNSYDGWKRCYCYEDMDFVDDQETSQETGQEQAQQNGGS